MSRTAKNAVIIMVATLLSRVLGFLRETILANFYGTSMVADVFVLTFNIPGLIISIVGSVIYMMYIPMYYDTRDRLGENEALKFTNNILNILSVFSIIVSILGIIFAGEIIKTAYGLKRTILNPEYCSGFEDCFFPGYSYSMGHSVIMERSPAL